MKRIALIAAAIVLLSSQFALASESSITKKLRVGAGGGMIYDPLNQDPAVTNHVTIGYTISPKVELELRGITTNDFELENDLTHGKASINAVTLGARYITPEKEKTRGFVSFAMGALEIEADKAAAGEKDSIDGVIARMGVGVDFTLCDAFALTLESGFSRGFGDTSEVLLFDAVTTLSYRF